MNTRPRSLIANIVSGTLTATIVIGLAYFIYEKNDSFSLFTPSGKIESEIAASPKPIASERIDEEQVSNEMNRIAEEKRKAEERRKAEEARKIAEAKRKAEEAKRKAEAEKKRLADIEAKRVAEEKRKAAAAEQKRLDEIALKKKQEEEKKAEEKKKKDEQIRQQKLADEKKEKQKQEEIKKQKEAKDAADKKAASDKAAADKKAADAKAASDKAAADAKAAAEKKALADAKIKADAAAKADGMNALNDASYQSRLAEAFRNQWNIGMDAIGYRAEVAMRVDKTGKILNIVESESKWSGNSAFDANVRATVWRVARVPVPDNPNGVNQLANQILYITFDPKDMGLSYY